MFDQIIRFFKKEQNLSKNIAKERIKLVLIHDRAGVSQHFLEKIKEEIIEVISKYMEIELGELDIQLTNLSKDGDHSSTALIANIPIRKVKSVGKNQG